MKRTLRLIPVSLLALTSCSNREVNIAAKERTIMVT